MSKIHCFILYNPLAGGGSAGEKSEKLAALLPDFEINYRDITKIRDYAHFFSSLAKEDLVVICGGDGTLNHFVNKTAGLDIKNPVYVYAAGNANDFVHDFEQNRINSKQCVNDYLRYLPVVTVKGRDYRFINGVSCGTEGVISSLKVLFSDKSRSGLFKRLEALNKFIFRNRPCSAEVSVDGVKTLYDKVWMAPTVNRPCRKDGEGVSLLILHDCGVFRAIFSSPAIIRGEAGRQRGKVELISGNDVSVQFEHPMELQIDGELISGVSGYRVRSAEMIKKALPVSFCIPEAGLDSVYSV